VQETRLAASSAGRTPALHDPLLYTNRELSWLEFNQRVLDQATADHHPLLERVKFLAIVGSNLDEFFMVRVATLRKRQRAGLEQVSPDGLTVSQQLAAIRDRAVHR
jgi:polyphosphate kinase